MFKDHDSGTANFLNDMHSRWSNGMSEGGIANSGSTILIGEDHTETLNPNDTSTSTENVSDDSHDQQALKENTIKLVLRENYDRILEQVFPPTASKYMDPIFLKAISSLTSDQPHTLLSSRSLVSVSLITLNPYHFQFLRS
jgi:hypothetical protein